jgi:uncharacterized membrane protein
MLTKFPRISLALIILLGLNIRILGLGAKSLWLDELFSWCMVSMPFAEMNASYSAHPPLSYLLLRVWIACFGDSEVGMRSLAVVFGVGAILGAYFLTRVLLRAECLGKTRLPNDCAPGASLLAAFLVATSVLQVHASQQARMYSIGAFWFTWSSYALIVALTSERRRGVSWTAYTITSVAFLYTHYVSVLSLLSQAMFLFYYLMFCLPTKERYSQARYVIESGLLILAASLPLFHNLWGMVGIDTTGPIRPFNWQDRSWEITVALIATFDTQLHFGATIRAASVVFVVVTLLLVARQAGPSGFYLLVTGIVPLALLVAAGSLSRWRPYPRYYTFAQISWLIAIALVVNHSGRARPFLTVLAIMSSLFTCYLNWPVIGPASNPGIRDAVEFILKNRSLNEPIIAKTEYTLLGARYYARNDTRPLLVSRHVIAESSMFPLYITDDDLITPETLAASIPKSAWFIWSTAHVGSVIRFGLPEHLQLIERREFAVDREWERPIIVERYSNKQQQRPK